MQSSQGMEDKETEMASSRVYDKNSRTADFSRKRGTDTGLHKRIKLPDPVTIQKETKIQALVDDLEEATMKAGRQASMFLRDGRPTQSTLTEYQLKGRTSVKAREKAGELVLVGSDKSGKRAVMTTDIYTAS